MIPRVLPASLALVAFLVSTSAFAQTKTYLNPNNQGKRIDKCIDSPARGNQRCSGQASRTVAIEFCKRRKHTTATNFTIENGTHLFGGPVSIWTEKYRRGRRISSYFRNGTGRDTFKTITCRGGAGLGLKGFSRPKIFNLRIDKCFFPGGGWEGTSGRCLSEATIADFFCRDKGYKRRYSHKLEGDIGRHAALLFPRPKGKGAQWKYYIYGSDAFRSITCEPK